MHIPSYQIRNVLNSYRNQLCQAAADKNTAALAEGCGRNDKNAVRGRRQAIINMVGVDVFDKINRFCTRLHANGKTDLQMQMALEEPVELKQEGKNQFYFHVMDENHKKTRRSLSVGDTHIFLPSVR